MPSDQQQLTEPIIRLILLGPAAMPALSLLTAADSALVRWLFQGGGPAYAELWMEHEAFLRQAATRLGVTPPTHHSREFYAEAIARRLSEAAMRRAVAESVQAASIHEAAHSVLSEAFGIAVSVVRLCDRRSAMPLGGYVRYGLTRTIDEEDASVRAELQNEHDTDTLQPPVCPSPGQLAEYCQVLLAGGAAERRLGAPPGDGDWHDRWQAEQLLGQALQKPPYGADVQRKLRTLEKLTARLVAEHWPAIVRIASALRRRGFLTGDDVRRLSD